MAVLAGPSWENAAVLDGSQAASPPMVLQGDVAPARDRVVPSSAEVRPEKNTLSSLKYTSSNIQLANCRKPSSRSSPSSEANKDIHERALAQGTQMLACAASVSFLWILRNPGSDNRE